MPPPSAPWFTRRLFVRPTTGVTYIPFRTLNLSCGFYAPRFLETSDHVLQRAALFTGKTSFGTMRHNPCQVGMT